MTKESPLPRSLTAVGGSFDFKTAPSFAVPYLRTYYCQPPTIDETVLSKFIIEERHRLSGRGRFIEIGCGPTLHHAPLFAPVVSEIHMADYLEENLAQVRLWRDGAKEAHDWSAYTRLTLRHEEIEPTEENVQIRERLVRTKITRIATCDLMRETPASEQGQYEAVGAFYVAEEVGISDTEWRRVMKRITDYLAPGGTLFMAALAGMDGYHVKSPGGEDLMYPCARVTKEGMASVLAELGFPTSKTRIHAEDIDHPDCGVAATLVVAATRP